MQSFRSLWALGVLTPALSLCSIAQNAAPTSQPVVQASQPSQTAPSASAATPSAKPNQARASVEAMPEAGDNDVRLGPGDLVDINVYGLPDMREDARVSSTGDISMPLIGTVRFGGLTASQAEWTVERALINGGYLKNPQVTVFVKEYNAEGISVFGEVQKPGVYPPLGSRRLFDVISAAGGMTPAAGNKITITRRGEAKPISITVPQDPAELASSDVQVFPGDTVQVSKAGIVYVVGAVAKPGGFVMDNREHMTVLQAVAMAQGTNPTAALNRAKLIRRSADGKRSELPVALGDILHSKSEDLDMRADDILFVPSSAGKSVARKSIESVISVATGVAIYHR